MHTGIDYLVNIQNPSSRTFTVTFQAKQANSSENDIQVADDTISERTKTFRLRVAAARFIGQAAAFFRAQDGMSNTVADVTIKDNDSKFMNIYTLYHLFGNSYEDDLYLYIYLSCMHCLLPQLYRLAGLSQNPLKSGRERE